MGLFLAVCVVLFFINANTALAVDDLGLFELEGNAIEPEEDNTDLPGVDWETPLWIL